MSFIEGCEDVATLGSYVERLLASLEKKRSIRMGEYLLTAKYRLGWSESSGSVDLQALEGLGRVRRCAWQLTLQ